MTIITVAAKDGMSFDVARGQQIRITTPKGHQAADFFAYNTHSVVEWLSPPHTWIANCSLTPRSGDVLLSRFRNPMLEMVEDGGEGIHDMLLPACDQFRYEFFGHEGPHPSCSDNLMTAMRRRGHEVSVIPQPINFFTHTTYIIIFKFTKIFPLTVFPNISFSFFFVLFVNKTNDWFTHRARRRDFIRSGMSFR